MSALLPSQDRRPTEAPAAAIPAQRGVPPTEIGMPEPAAVPRQRSVAVWSVVAGMAAGAIGTLTAAAIVSAPAVVPVPQAVAREIPEPRVAFAGTVSVPGRELTSFGDGTWQVGIDVAPGTYTTTGGPDCRYALRPAATGADIVGNTVSPNPSTVVLSNDSGYFATSGCTTWRRLA